MTGTPLAEMAPPQFKLEKVTRISVLACFAAGDPAVSNPDVKSFAEVFHSWLGRRRNIYTQVTARTKVITSSNV